MGTNYYLHLDTCPTCKHAKERIHIGKSSWGWTFTFKAYLNEWDTLRIGTAHDWRKRTKEGIIVDEYGKEESYDDFWKMVDDKSKAEHNHAKEYPDGNFLDAEGHSFSTYEFS